MEDLHWSVISFLAGAGVKERRSKLADFVDHSLSGGFVKNGCANIVLFKKVEETGKVTNKYRKK